MKKNTKECNVAPDWIRAALEDLESSNDPTEPSGSTESDLCPCGPEGAPLGFV